MTVNVFFTTKSYMRTNHKICRQKRFASNRSIILGIETSCDDTGCAVVDNEGNILGEALHSQHLIHLK